MKHPWRNMPEHIQYWHLAPFEEFKSIIKVGFQPKGFHPVSWKSRIIPKLNLEPETGHFVQLRTVPGLGGGKGLVVLRRISRSTILDRVNLMTNVFKKKHLENPSKIQRNMKKPKNQRTSFSMFFQQLPRGCWGRWPRCQQLPFWHHQAARR